MCIRDRFHSTEAYISCKANRMSDMFARRASELIGRSLVRAVKDLSLIHI